MIIDAGIKHDAIDVLLQDSGWLRAEFEAIMTASGFNHGLIVATRVPVPAPDLTGLDPVTDPVPLRRLRTDESLSRVRSPPA